jgi:hypothetical protein
MKVSSTTVIFSIVTSLFMSSAMAASPLFEFSTTASTLFELSSADVQSVVEQLKTKIELGQVGTATNAPSNQTQNLLNNFVANMDSRMTCLAETASDIVTLKCSLSLPGVIYKIQTKADITSDNFQVTGVSLDNSPALLIMKVQGTDISF